MFLINDLNQNTIQEMISSGCWSKDSPLQLDELSELTISYLDFEDNVRNDGILIVAKAIAKEIILIFKQLLDIGFNIDNITPIHKYHNASDELSMEANSTTCFNFRKIVNSNVISIHSYGCAIDINPVQNPYLRFNHDQSTILVEPSLGMKYINRAINKKGMINSKVIEIFSQFNFEWGGDWHENMIDYHHFQLPRNEIKKLNIIL